MTAKTRIVGAMTRSGRALPGLLKITEAMKSEPQRSRTVIRPPVNTPRAIPQRKTFIPLFHLFLGNQLGNSERKAVRGEDQADIIDLIGRIVITDPLIAENACHGYFIKESDQADNDAGGRQDRPLHQEIGFISFLLLWHGKIPPIICLSKQAETSSILLYISALVYIYFSFWENLPEGKGKAEKIL